MAHIPENEIVGTTFYTIDNILSFGNNGPDALALYFKYIEQSRIQQNNNTYSLDVFMMKKMNWGELRLRKSKKILKDLGLIDQIQNRGEDGRVVGLYVRVNFMINQDKIRESNMIYEINDSIPGVIHTLDNPLGGEGETNTLILNTNTSIHNINTLSEEKILPPELEIETKSKKEINIGFEVFRDLYDKKIDKEKCIKKRNKLTDIEREMAIKHIPQYKLSQPDKKYRKNPETYINNKSRDNEIISGGLDYTNIQNFHEMMMQDRVAELKQALGTEKYFEIKKLRKQDPLYLSR